MIATQIPKTSTNDEGVVIDLGNEIKILIQQSDNGVFSKWAVTAYHPSQPQPKVEFITYVSSSGEFVACARTMPGVL